MNKTNPIRQLAAVLLLLMLAFPLSAQEMTDSVRTFRFFAGRDGFYAPGLNNGEELARLFEFVDQYKDMIKGHEMMLYVDGYCNSRGAAAENFRMARIRSKRVKSELITRKGLTEDCFSTRNHTEQGDFVLVRAFIPEALRRPRPQPEEKKEVREDTVPQVPEVILPQEQPVDTVVVAEVVEEFDSAAVSPARQSVTLYEPENDSKFLLKTNLLDYTILMLNVEGEWKFADRMSLALELQRAWYAKRSPHKVYRIGTVIPEVRYWVIEHSRWNGMYVGAFVGGTMYDLSKGWKGHKGEGLFGGLSTGYMWRIGKRLSLDAGIGVGYLYARDKVYVPRDNHFLYQLTKNVSYFGPLRLKLSLVWRFQIEKNQSVK